MGLIDGVILFSTRVLGFDVTVFFFFFFCFVVIVMFSLLLPNPPIGTFHCHSTAERGTHWEGMECREGLLQSASAGLEAGATSPPFLRGLKGRKVMLIGGSEGRWAWWRRGVRAALCGAQWRPKGVE